MLNNLVECKNTMKNKVLLLREKYTMGLDSKGIGSRRTQLWGDIIYCDCEALKVETQKNKCFLVVEPLRSGYPLLHACSKLQV